MGKCLTQKPMRKNIDQVLSISIYGVEAKEDVSITHNLRQCLVCLDYHDIINNKWPIALLFFKLH
jgi:hypothetical protein